MLNKINERWRIHIMNACTYSTIYTALIYFIHLPSFLFPSFLFSSLWISSSPHSCWLMRLSALIFSGCCDENYFSALPKILSNSCGKWKKKRLITQTNVGWQEGFSVLVATQRYESKTESALFDLCEFRTFWCQ